MFGAPGYHWQRIMQGYVPVWIWLSNGPNTKVYQKFSTPPNGADIIQMHLMSDNKHILNVSNAIIRWFVWQLHELYIMPLFHVSQWECSTYRTLSPAWCTILTNRLRIAVYDRLVHNNPRFGGPGYHWQRVMHGYVPVRMALQWAQYKGIQIFSNSSQWCRYHPNTPNGW